MKNQFVCSIDFRNGFPCQRFSFHKNVFIKSSTIEITDNIVTTATRLEQDFKCKSNNEFVWERASSKFNPGYFKFQSAFFGSEERASWGSKSCKTL